MKKRGRKNLPQKKKKPLTFWKSVLLYRSSVRNTTEYGGIAQLGERLNGIQEVSGSIPLISTRLALKTIGFQGFFCLYGTFVVGAETF